VTTRPKDVMERSYPERGETQRRLDVDLVIDARSGDRDAFDRLMAGRAEPAFRTAMAILGHEADARDATQEVFVKAWRQLRGLRDAEAFDAWLGRILVNTCRTTLRGRRRSQVREASASFVADAMDEPADRSAGGFEDRTAELDELERAFERLAPGDRILLVLHHLEHRPLAGIAATLGIPEGTAKSRLYAARRALQRAIEVERR
jgi:RNA polymerase sigma-70 factor (ECF subfamily)